MKKIIILLILFVGSAVGIQAVELHGFFDVGYERFENTWITEIEIRLEQHFIIDHTIYGGQTVLFKRDDLNGKPYNDVYGIGYRAQHKNIYLEIEHFCSHKVISEGIYHDQYESTIMDYTDIQIGKNQTSFKIGIEW